MTLIAWSGGVLCDHMLSLKLKGNFYKTAIRQSMVYASECEECEMTCPKSKCSWSLTLR